MLPGAYRKSYIVPFSLKPKRHWKCVCKRGRWIFILVFPRLLDKSLTHLILKSCMFITNPILNELSRATLPSLYLLKQKNEYIYMSICNTAVCHRCVRFMVSRSFLALIVTWYSPTMSARLYLLETVQPHAFAYLERVCEETVLTKANFPRSVVATCSFVSSRTMVGRDTISPRSLCRPLMLQICDTYGRHCCRRPWALWLNQPVYTNVCPKRPPRKCYFAHIIRSKWLWS